MPRPAAHDNRGRRGFCVVEWHLHTGPVAHVAARGDVGVLHKHVVMTGPGSVEPDEVIALAREIESYLTEHPSASDSVEGIARWWLRRQRLQPALGQVQRALDFLVRSQRVRVRRNHEGTQLFSTTDLTGNRS